MTPPTDNQPSSQDDRAAEIAAVKTCKLPPFWREHPDVWFYQVESVFQSANVKTDNDKYHIVVSNLTNEAMLSVIDIIKSPPEKDKYVNLKSQLMRRLADSADQQLHKVLAELELDGRKPSELLRLMRSMVADQVPENVLRVRWLASLPATVQKLLKVFQSSASLDDLAAGADTLMESGNAPQFVMATSSQPSLPSTQPLHLVTNDPLLTELQHIRTLLNRLIDINREALSKPQQPGRHNNSRSRSRNPRSHPPNSTGTCYYHHNYGNLAKKCNKPCTYGLSSEN